MKKYTLSLKSIVYVLFICAFFQNCNSCSNYANKLNKEINEYIDIQPIIGKTFKTSDNHYITFYKKSNVLKARIQILDKIYDGITVNIEKGRNLANLVKLDEEIQQKRIITYFEQEKPIKVLIRKAWLFDEEEDMNNETIVLFGNPGVGKSALC